MTPTPESSVPKLHGIVVAVDASPASRVATDWAARDVALRHVPLTVVHVLPSDEIGPWVDLPVRPAARRRGDPGGGGTRPTSRGLVRALPGRSRPPRRRPGQSRPATARGIRARTASGGGQSRAWWIRRPPAGLGEFGGSPCGAHAGDRGTEVVTVGRSTAQVTRIRVFMPS
jgi:hypothetical protein